MSVRIAHAVPLLLASLCAFNAARAAVSPADLRCQDCVAGPFEVTQSAGPPSSDSIAFPSFAGPGYEVLIREWSIGGAGAEVALNGVTLLDVRGSASRGAPPAGIAVTLADANTLDVTLRGPGGRLVIEVRATDAAELPTCGPPDARQFFTAPLTPVADLVAWEPLGALNGPAHTLPTHHSYPNPPRVAGSPADYDIMAPGRVRLVAVEHLPGNDDFSLHLRPCAEVRMYLLHVKRLGGRLSSLLGDPAVWAPIPAIVPGFGNEVALTSIDFSPGELLGYTRTGDVPNYDVGLIDTRQPLLGFINPARYALPDPASIPGVPEDIARRVIPEVAPDRLRQFCALDYFEPVLGSQYMALLGSIDGSMRRSAPPICGEHMQDLAGTAQGNWFRPTLPGSDPSTADREDDDFAFAHDYVDPSVPVISLSNRGPVIAGPSPGTTVHRVTYPVAVTPGGQVNQDPSVMVPGQLYCFDDLSSRIGGPLAGFFLMDLPDASTIRVFYSPVPIACNLLLLGLPADFELSGPDVFDYER